MSQEFLTMEEVSARLRLPISTLRYWRLTGADGPKSFTMGRRVFYMADDVEAFIVAQHAAGAGGTDA